MDTNYDDKVGMIEIGSPVGFYDCSCCRNVGFLRFLRIWITKRLIFKAMTFYFNENEPLTMLWYCEEEHPFAPKSGFPKKVRS